MELEQEVATYREKLPELMQHKGKYVVIHGDRVIDTFPSYEEAIRQGYRNFGLQPFLVKRILEIEPIQFIPRLILSIRAATWRQESTDKDRPPTE